MVRTCLGMCHQMGKHLCLGRGGQGSPQEFLIANVMVYFLGLKNGGVGRDQASPLWLLSLLSIAA